MRDAQGEEFKHFCMDLEFLLRRTPAWREIARGRSCFKLGDIVEHGEEAEARRRSRETAPRAPRAGTRQDRWASAALGERSDEPPTPPARSDHRRGLGDARRGGGRALKPGARGAQAGRFAGPHGWQHSATNLGRTRTLAGASVKGGERAPAPGAAAGRVCAPTSRCRSPSCATPTGAPTTPTSVTLDKAALPDRGGGEHRGVHGGRPPHHRRRRSDTE